MQGGREGGREGRGREATGAFLSKRYEENETPLFSIW